MKTANHAMQTVTQRTLDLTAPPELNPLVQLRQWEIRQDLAKMEPDHRFALLMRTALAGDLSVMHAILMAPATNPLMSEDRLTAARIDYAYKKNPMLAAAMRDATTLATEVRKAAAAVNGVAAEILVNYGLDNPVPPAEHYRVFVPMTEHERAYAEKRILQWQRQQDKAERQQTFENAQPGVNLQ